MKSIKLKTSRLQTQIAAVAAVLLLGAAASSHGATLVNPGFENNSLVPFGTVLGTNAVPMTPGVWGQENSTITGTVLPVSPNAGVRMLSMLNSGGVTTQAGQAIPLTAADIALVNSPLGANVTFGALFNSATAGPVGAVGVSFFGNSFYSSILTPPFYAASAALDNAPGSWLNQIQVTAKIPVGTTWMLAQVYYSNATLFNAVGPQAGYVDDAFLSINPVPEPATWALMGLGALAIGWRQRARRQLP